MNDNDHVPVPSKLVEDVLGLLEEAGCPTNINDQIATLIEAWESERGVTLEEQMSILQQEEARDGK